MNVVILDTGCANLNSGKVGNRPPRLPAGGQPRSDVVLRADKLFYPASVPRRRLWIRFANAS